MKFSVGQWVVCKNFSLQPSTWGKITSTTPTDSQVRYGKDAPHWQSNMWDNEYLEIAASEEAARKVVEDYEKSIPYDPR